MADRILFGLYSSLIFLADIFIWIGSLFSRKLYLLRSGRNDCWAILEIKKSNHVKNKKIWIHCASLGEFEQGRPLIEKLKCEHPDAMIYLSFFSPSGYEIQKNYDKADVVFYLPSDTTSHGEKLINLIHPDLVIVVKYEFWWNLLRCLIVRGTPIYLISSVFRKSDYFWHPVFQPFKKIIRLYTQIFVQDNLSAQVLKEHECTNFLITGDTRIDRVIQRAHQTHNPSDLKLYTHGRNVLVYGSVWMSDMSVVSHVVQSFPDFVHILAPHDITDQNIHNIRKILHQNSSLFSEKKWQTNIIIIDNIGMLASLYALARYAYVGGGFQKGIHNTLEPAVFQIPVFFGPNYKKFNEAITLIEISCATEVTKPEQMIRKIHHLEASHQEYQNIAHKLNGYFESNQGATQKIYDTLSKKIQ